jgi:hypothetical protein
VGALAAARALLPDRVHPLEGVRAAAVREDAGTAATPSGCPWQPYPTGRNRCVLRAYRRFERDLRTIAARAPNDWSSH